MQLDSKRHALTVITTLLTTSVRREFVDLKLKPDLRHDIHWGVDRTSGPAGWANFGSVNTIQSTAFLSKAYRYKTLVRRYSPVRRSTVKALVSEKPFLSFTTSKGRQAVRLGLTARKDSCQRYLIISNRSITDTSTREYSVGAITSAEWSWLDPNGSYEKGPDGIEPFTRVGYVWSLRDMRALETFKAYRATRSSLLEDLLTSNLYTLAITRPADGLWRSKYTSTWVKTESGIVAPYIDTRFNEALAIMSKRIADELTANGVAGLRGARQWTRSFGQYLLGRERANAVVRTPNGLLFPDYYDYRGTLRVHTSLNHALGEMNYLFDMYRETSSTPYLNLAKGIKGGLDDTGLAWIRPNHDLWYERDLDGTYCGDDYVYVTYFDLLAARARIAAILNETDPTLEALIASKERYLGIAPSLPTTTTALPSMHVPTDADLSSRHELP
jgi:hypothetical protein